MSRVLLTVDLGFGDAGKGSIVDYLTRVYEAHTVVRYNGGAQAAHRVVTDDGREHVFSQFGSGALAGAATHLSRFMLLDPPAMLAEAAHLASLGAPNALARTTIEAGALVITPFGRAINRLRELARGQDRHGSCGMGIGETVADHLRYGEQVLFAGDLRDPAVVARKLRFLHTVALTKLAELRPGLPDNPDVERELDLLRYPGSVDWVIETYGELAREARIVGEQQLQTLLRGPGTVIFEGAQGVLLDEWRGFHPYTTWSTTTLANADQLLASAGYSGSVTRIGITRAYTPRHGAGPLPSEDPALTTALPDARNRSNPWQQGFRVGWLDLVLLRYALASVGPLDMLALTCLDRLEALDEHKLCRGYRHNGERISTLRPAPRPSLDYQERLTRLLLACRPELEPLAEPATLPELLSAELGVPVGLISRGPAAAAKQLAPGVC